MGLKSAPLIMVTLIIAFSCNFVIAALAPAKVSEVETNRSARKNQREAKKVAGSITDEIGKFMAAQSSRLLSHRRRAGPHLHMGDS